MAGAPPDEVRVRKSRKEKKVLKGSGRVPKREKGMSPDSSPKTAASWIKKIDSRGEKVAKSAAKPFKAEKKKN